MAAEQARPGGWSLPMNRCHCDDIRSRVLKAVTSSDSSPHSKALRANRRCLGVRATQRSVVAALPRRFMAAEHARKRMVPGGAALDQALRSEERRVGKE